MKISLETSSGDKMELVTNDVSLEQAFEFLNDKFNIVYLNGRNPGEVFKAALTASVFPPSEGPAPTNSSPNWLTPLETEIDNLSSHWSLTALISILHRLNREKAQFFPFTLQPGPYTPVFPTIPSVPPNDWTPSRPYVGDPMPGTWPVVTCGGTSSGMKGVVAINAADPIPVLCTPETCKIGCTVPPLNHGVGAVSQADGDGLSHTD